MEVSEDAVNRFKTHPNGAAFVSMVYTPIPHVVMGSRKLREGGGGGEGSPWPLIKGSRGGCGEMWICAWKGTALVFTKGPTLMQRRVEVMDDGVGPRIFGLTQNFFLWSFQPLKVTWIKASYQCLGAVPRTRKWDPTLTQCKMMGVDHRQVCVGVGVPHQELFLLEYVLDVLSQIMDGWGALNWKGIL